MAACSPSRIQSDKGPAASPEPLTRRAGLTVVHREDVTPQFRAGCEALLRAHTHLESTLRAEEGDEVFEEERTRKTAMLTGVREGLLVRSLVVAVAPSSAAPARPG